VCDAVFISGEAELFERVRDDGHGLIVRLAEIEGAEGDVLPDRGAEELVFRVLEKQADAAADVVEIVLRSAGEAEGADFSRVGLEQSDDEVEQGRLACAVSADKADAIALFECQAEAVQDGFPRPVAEGDVA